MRIMPINVNQIISAIQQNAADEGRDVVVAYDVEIRRLLVVDVPSGFVCCHICLSTISPSIDEASLAPVEHGCYRGDICPPCASDVAAALAFREARVVGLA